MARAKMVHMKESDFAERLVAERQAAFESVTSSMKARNQQLSEAERAVRADALKALSAIGQSVAAMGNTAEAICRALCSERNQL